MNNLKKLLNHSILKNLSQLVIGTVIAQLIVIGFQVVLRRLYSPEEFGAFAVYMSLMGILATISSLRYEQTIVLPKESRQGYGILLLSCLIAAFFSILLFLIILFLHNEIVRWINFPPQYSIWLYFLPISIFLFSVVQALNFYLIRIKKFGFSAQNKVIRRTFEGVTQTSFGFLTKSFGLILGDMVGQLLVAVRTLFKLRKTEKVKLNDIDLKQNLKEYKDFPLKNGLPALMNALSLLLPVLFINRLFDEATTGYFDLARTVLIVPLALVTTSLSQVLLQRFSEKRNLGQSVKKEAGGTFLLLLVSAIVFVFVIQFWAEPLFQWIFGSEWLLSGSYAKILVIAFAIKFVVSPFNMVFTAFKKIGILSIWQTLYFFLILLLIIIPFESIETFLSTYVLIEVISYSIIGFLDAYFIFVYEKKIK